MNKAAVAVPQNAKQKVKRAYTIFAEQDAAIQRIHGDSGESLSHVVRKLLAVALKTREEDAK